MIINHNLMANNAIRNMNINSNAASKSMQKLSSGLRINSAADDAAGLSISEKMRGQIRGLDQASANAQDGISMVQTAEGALNETTSILQRMRELANQAANGTNTTADRSSIQDEINQLTSEINRIGNTTEFNTQKLLNGGVGSNDGDKITKATAASIQITGVINLSAALAFTAGASITVDNQSFALTTINLTAATGYTSTTTLIDALGKITSGGIELSDVVDISVDSNGALNITNKSTGASSTITMGAQAANGFSTVAITATLSGTGDPTLVERAGLQATAAIISTSALSISVNDGFKIKVGSDSEVTVLFDTDKTYATDDADDNVASAARADFIKDLNAALQKAGISDKVTASLSKDNEVQLISESGKDLDITSVTGMAGAQLTATGDIPMNVQQVVGPGAQGSGFNTTFQIGANKGQSMALNINDMRSAALGITGNAGQSGFTETNGVTNGTTDVKQEAALNVTTKEDASKALETLDKATALVSAERGKLGAIQNRLEHTINNLGTSSENLTSAESRIRDVDMAKEMSTFSKNNILSQAAQAMLAQANQQPQQVLQLLR